MHITDFANAIHCSRRNAYHIFKRKEINKQHLRIQSQYVDKICSLFKQSACNNALESKAAKLFGIIGWAEVGLGYFLTNALLLLFAPALIPYIALINIVTLPFSFWSVWYQKTKAEKEAYYKDWGLDITDPKVEEEFEKHEAWRKETLIRATPTILVNGYQLPEGYKVEDLENFIKFNLDIK